MTKLRIGTLVAIWLGCLESAAAQPLVQPSANGHPSIQLTCPNPPYLLNPQVDVSVTKNKLTGKYLYRYRLTPSKTDQQLVFSFVLSGLATSTVSEKFRDWELCGIQPSSNNLVCMNSPPAPALAYSGLEIESAAGPGTVRYEIEGASQQPLVTQAEWETLLPYFNYKADVLSELIQESVGEQCPSGQVTQNSDRVVTGVTIGPSSLVGIQAALRQYLPSPKAKTALEFTIVDSPDVKADDVDLKSVRLLDSRGVEIARGSAALQQLPTERNAGLALKADNLATLLPCNVKGVLIDGTTRDGRAFRGGFTVLTPSCLADTSATFTLPTKFPQ